MTTPTFTDKQLADGRRALDLGKDGDSWGVVCPRRKYWGTGPGPVGCGTCETCVAFTSALRGDNSDTAIDITMPKHPSVEHILQFFTYEHLPDYLQKISKPFCDLASTLAKNLEGPELTICLRKMLEAKDCAVRATFIA